MIQRIKDRGENIYAVPGKFIISGVVNTLITYLLFLGATRFFNTSIAYTIIYATGIGIAYLLNALFVFKTGHSKQMAIAVPFAYVMQYFYGLAALNILIHLFRFPGFFAMMIVSASAFPLQYLILQFVADRTKQRVLSGRR